MQFPIFSEVLHLSVCTESKCHFRRLGMEKKKFGNHRFVRLACDGIWALVELGPLLCIPIPFSVRNSSRSMYWSWNKPPSHGRVLSQSKGPRKADWELGRNELDPRDPPTPPGPPPLTPSESSSESRGLSLSEEKERTQSLFEALLILRFWFYFNKWHTCEKIVFLSYWEKYQDYVY